MRDDVFERDTLGSFIFISLSKLFPFELARRRPAVPKLLPRLLSFAENAPLVKLPAWSGARSAVFRGAVSDPVYLIG